MAGQTALLLGALVVAQASADCTIINGTLSRGMPI
jgi:hypothetical protein